MAQIIGLPVGALLIMAIIRTSCPVAAAAADQDDEACLPPGEYGSFNYGCNKDILPYIGSSQQVQQSVLTSITNEFARRFPGGRAGVCYEGYYGGGDHSSSSSTDIVRKTIKMFSYASCSVGYMGKDCYMCLLHASQTIREHCGDRVGGQARSEICCVRYEEYNFIENLKYC